LHYQVVLRGFADDNRYVIEFKSVGRVSLDLAGSPSTVTHEMAEPLACNMPPGRGPASYTVEVDLSWQANHGAPPLALSSLPRCCSLDD
jgi:hypothetical protein